MHSESQTKSLLVAAIALLALPAFAADRDKDGLRDEVETSTGVYVSPSDTGTNPDLPDTDGDHLPDGIELNLGTNPTDSSSKSRRPNIIFIIADDLAYGDVGCFWQNQRTGIWKFSTPGLDTMASQGAMMTHHYAGSAVCASSRASFLLGQHQGNALIRDAEFDRPLPDNHNVAGMLKAAGYRTIHIGKAGLAGTNINPRLSSQDVPAHPLKRGFDRFFGYLRHTDGWEHYPRNGTAPNLALIHNDYQPITDAYVDLHTTDVFTAFAKKTIIEETQQHPDRPFFIYLAYDTPHFDGCTSPTKTYPAGKGLNGGIQWLGAPAYANTAINDPNRVNNIANVDPSCNSAWNTGAKQYVSMIKRLDDSVADLLQTLRDLDVEENTLVVFTSDNGSSDKFCGAAVFQSSAGFEGAKFDIWEGGLRVPTIAWGPGIVQGTNQIQNIRNITTPSAGYDWMATFADLAKTTPPATSDGISQLPVLKAQGVQKQHDYLFFDLLYGGYTSRYPDFPNHGGELRYQMQSIRIGDLVGVRNNIQAATDRFRIYNIISDPKQANDISASVPAIQEKMQRLSVGSRRKGTGLWTRVYDNARIPAISPSSVRSGINVSSFTGYWASLPDFEQMSPDATFGASTISADSLPRQNDCGLSFDGYLKINTAGSYTFETTSSGPASLWLHGGLAIDNDVGFTNTRASAALNLSVGLHPIRLNFRHAGGTPMLQLKYSGPGISNQPVPSSALFQDGIPTNLTADSAVADRGVPATVDVLANDVSEAGLTLTTVGTPVHGSASIEANRVRYVSNPGFIGRESFAYEADDGWTRASSRLDMVVLSGGEIWFPFDERTGTTTKGYSATGAPSGVLEGFSSPAIPWVRGKSGRAIRFDGIDDQVGLSGLQLPQGSSPRSISCWIRTSSSSPTEKQSIFSYGGNGSWQRFTLRLAPSSQNPLSQNLCLEAAGGTIVGTKTINDGNWHHVCAMIMDRNHDGLTSVDEARFHVDGLPDSIRVEQIGIVLTGTGLTPMVGGSAHDPNYHFSGDIDDLRIFSREVEPALLSFLSTTPPITPDSAAGGSLPDDDDDGDGFSNPAEAAAGTNPDDAGDFPRIIGITRSGSGIRLTWKGVAGRTYWVEESSNLANWVTVASPGPVVVNTSQPEVATTIPGNGAPSRFFRLRVQETPIELAGGASIAPSDQDGDGADDDAEFIAGTDPFDPSSFFSMRMSGAPSGAIRLEWSAVAGRSYRAEESANLTTWSPVQGLAPIIATENDPGMSREIQPNGWQRRFLRIAVSLSN